MLNNMRTKCLSKLDRSQYSLKNILHPLLVLGSKLVLTFNKVQSQSNEPKGHWITKKNNQNCINIYVLPCKAMAIMVSCFFSFI
jgi:hypothetical protein